MIIRCTMPGLAIDSKKVHSNPNYSFEIGVAIFIASSGCEGRMGWAWVQGEGGIIFLPCHRARTAPGWPSPLKLNN